jgi:hypothetical protein
MADSRREREVERDLKVVARFIDVYCRHQHPDSNKSPIRLKTHDVARICGKPVSLCAECRKLLAHAFVKRTHCPLDPKPMCKKCPDHCYAPRYAQRMREVMKFSGRRLVLSGRLDYLFHLLG